MKEESPIVFIFAPDTSCSTEKLLKGEREEPSGMMVAESGNFILTINDSPPTPEPTLGSNVLPFMLHAERSRITGLFASRITSSSCSQLLLEFSAPRSIAMGRRTGLLPFAR